MQDQRETYRNTLMEAMAIAGSEQALAIRLQVSTEQVRKWLKGADEIPTSAFLDAVDVVVEAKVQQITGERKAH